MVRVAGIAVCAALASASAACVNASRPASPHAVRDHIAPPPAAAASANPASASPAAPSKPRDPADDVPAVEIVPVEGSSIGRARAIVVVRASMDRVHAVLVDFVHYPDFLANYRKAAVVGTTPRGGSRVHMEIDALGGMIHRWMRVEISPPVMDGARETFDARLLEGNVKAFEARWVLERLDDRDTRLTLESYLDPDLTLPAAFINSGSASGLRDSILAVKARAEDAASN